MSYVSCLKAKDYFLTNEDEVGRRLGIFIIFLGVVIPYYCDMTIYIIIVDITFYLVENVVMMANVIFIM